MDVMEKITCFIHDEQDSQFRAIAILDFGSSCKSSFSLLVKQNDLDLDAQVLFE